MPNELITEKQFMESLYETWVDNCLAANLDPCQTLLQILKYEEMSVIPFEVRDKYEL